MAMEQAKLWGDEPPSREKIRIFCYCGGGEAPKGGGRGPQGRTFVSLLFAGGEAPKGEHSYLYYSRGASPPPGRKFVFFVLLCLNFVFCDLLIGMGT